MKYNKKANIINYDKKLTFGNIKKKPTLQKL